MGISMELGEEYLLPWKLLNSGSFHGSTWIFPLSMELEASLASINWKLPLLPSIEASTNIFHGSFHELSHTPTYFNLYPRVSQTSSCFSTRLTLTLTLSWSYLHGSWPTSNFHRSRWKYMEVVCCFHGSWSYLHGSWPTSNFHGSWWNLPGSRCR